MNGNSVVDLVIAPHAYLEKCAVAQYRTKEEQQRVFMEHLETCTREAIPLEWVIDLADESGEWFYGTAYHFNDVSNTLHVMVPDRLNPTYDGVVELDYRTVHLIECVDEKTDALFNKIVRDSIEKVKWDVDWFEEGEGDELLIPVAEGQDTAEVRGRWIPSIARYYIRLANQVLVEDSLDDRVGFVMLTADFNLRLKRCYRDRGYEDFCRLVDEGVVQLTEEASRMIAQGGAPDVGQGVSTNADDGALPERGAEPILPVQSSSPVHSDSDRRKSGDLRRSTDNGREQTPGSAVRRSEGDGTAPADRVPPLRKLAEMSRHLRESVSEVLEDREKQNDERKKMSNLFMSFALNGDLDAGMKLLTVSEDLIEKTETGAASSSKIEAASDDVWYLCQRLEKGLVRCLRADQDSGAAEAEHYKRAYKKLRRELDEREREIERLRGKPRR